MTTPNRKYVVSFETSGQTNEYLCMDSVIEAIINNEIAAIENDAKNDLGVIVDEVAKKKMFYKIDVYVRDEIAASEFCEKSLNGYLPVLDIELGREISLTLVFTNSNYVIKSVGV